VVGVTVGKQVKRGPNQIVRVHLTQGVGRGCPRNGTKEWRKAAGLIWGGVDETPMGLANMNHGGGPRKKDKRRG